MIPTAGRIWYLIRKNCREGWSTPYFRERVRPRILRTPPVDTAAGGEVEVHVLTSEADVLNLLWSLKTFYHYSGRDYPLVIFEDGTLTDHTAATLHAHFPRARLVRKREADSAIGKALSRYPRCLAYRRQHPLAQKALDTGYYLQGSRLLLLDTDLLFFACPTELLRCADDDDYRQCIFNADLQPALNISASEAAQRFGVELQERFNSGLGLLQRGALRFDWMEEFLASDAVCAGHVWRIEQTLLALAAGRLGAELLPESYRISLSPGTAGCVVKHYVGAVRHLMYREGISRLWQHGFLQALRAKAADSPPLERSA